MRTRTNTRYYWILVVTMTVVNVGIFLLFSKSLEHLIARYYAPIAAEGMTQ